MRLLQKPHRVQILELAFVPNFSRPRGAPKHSRRNEVAFLHIAVARADPLQRAANEVDVIVSLPARTEIRLGDDLGNGVPARFRST